MDFYDSIAENYDEMTNLASRADSIRAFVEGIKKRYGVTSAVDVACGTGGYAVAMSQMGISVVGADISAGMLKKARALAEQKRVQTRWINCPMQELSQHVNERFDIVLCLGNSIPHILTKDDLDKTISGFARVLRPGGVLLLQLLNYHKILKQKDRIVAITKNGDDEYIRFYDFLGELIQFNLLHICWKEKSAARTLTSTPLFAYKVNTLEKTLCEHGFSSINTYSDLNFNQFDEEKSGNLVLEAYLRG